MRIDGLARTAAGGASASKAAAPGGFRLIDAGAAAMTRQAAPTRPAPSLAALIALQTITETPVERRKREVKRGRNLLSALDGLKVAVMNGRGDISALAALARGLAEAREGVDDPGLDEVLAAIDLRAQVELAKRGR